MNDKDVAFSEGLEPIPAPACRAGHAMLDALVCFDATVSAEENSRAFALVIAHLDIPDSAGERVDVTDAIGVSVLLQSRLVAAVAELRGSDLSDIVRDLRTSLNLWGGPELHY
ncbi:hypothetical protein [Pseudoclavibacter sp. VKM Ac-2888]|uniref:hypothetical protein n=1 Tax=Pseudoclavibacter sp. VKM Ac-2888 TaxID=2783830 RepID=UPI001889F657|nr:hypothetical protein [Pseudoclavibacter sp. VKM Ac-2888]MBF4549472.1 hypothetical protein [Pseudoclavibacter sp. VKM Ac-2888]